MRSPVKFRARMPVMVEATSRTRVIPKYKWDALPDEKRYPNPSYWNNKFQYMEIVPVPAYENPAVERMRAKLKRKRVPYQESLETMPGTGRQFINIISEGWVLS